MHYGQHKTPQALGMAPGTIPRARGRGVCESGGADCPAAILWPQGFLHPWGRGDNPLDKKNRVVDKGDAQCLFEMCTGSFWKFDYICIF